MTEPKDEPKQDPARIAVWPRKGIQVLDEYTKTPIEPGQEVPYTRLTVRRINDGDLETKDPDAPTAAARTTAEHFGKKG